MNKLQQSMITSLLEKHALGICTPEEMDLLQQWYAAFPENGSVWENKEEKEAMKDALKANIFNAITPAQVVSITQAPDKTQRKIWWSAAAVVAVLVVTYLLYNKYNYKKGPEYIVVTAVAGKGIIKHELPDHSEIWLEPGTTIRYHKDFVRDVRIIELTDGMAFFSVHKDAQHPFLVKTPGGVQTKVLGTEFTVKAYAQLAIVQVMVTSGIVQVSDSTHILDTLKADQQLSYEQHTHAIKRMDGPPEDWRSGELALNNAPFAEVARILTNRYGLQVSYNEKAVARYSFTIHISQQTTADDLLELLKDISGLTYVLNNGKVTIQ
ncbi:MULTISPECIES: FecR family protein [Niastella]|uniref:FecR domain-containing protein n=1 Tax=Niastella soli TaxID=2821487 RepID=A0ABS3YVR8_9BACT|nr:FecR family protein [Niastella soli]MBO9202024.1 FecR domain-containing protein [Niastella soli]